MAFLLAEALHIIPALHIIGGIVLAWIAVKLLMDQDEETHVEAKDSLRDAIITIVLADAMMSIDNVIGVVAAAQGIMELVVLGMLVTVPIIIFSASLFAKLISRMRLMGSKNCNNRISTHTIESIGIAGNNTFQSMLL